MFHHSRAQSLLAIHLGNNELGAAAAQHLSGALLFNRVRFSLLPLHQITYFAIKTLTTLDLSYNEIGDDGVQSLVTALLQNKVESTSGATHHLTLYSCRHSRHSTFYRMESVRMEQLI